MMKDLLTFNGIEFQSRLLHCFGMPTYSIDDADLAVNLIKESGTSFLTLYTHGDFMSYKTIDDFPLGYAGLKYKDIKYKLNLINYTTLVNTNHALSSDEAVEKSIVCSEIIGSRYIKLEVLSSDGIVPVNSEVLKAAKRLIQDDYIVLPIIDRFDLSTAKELEAIGCACIRVLLSDIGSLGGMSNPEFFKKLCESVSIPIIAEGGVKGPEDGYSAMSLGAGGILVNKAIFTYNDPFQFMRVLKSSINAGRETYLCNLNTK